MFFFFFFISLCKYLSTIFIEIPPESILDLKVIVDLIFLQYLYFCEAKKVIMVHELS